MEEDPEALPGSESGTPMRIDPLEARAEDLVLGSELLQAFVQGTDLGAQRSPEGVELGSKCLADPAGDEDERAGHRERPSTHSPVAETRIAPEHRRVVHSRPR
jgi:hypothetical protein